MTNRAASLTQLVGDFDLSLSPRTINSALERAGVIRVVSYLSTTGSGQEKHFRVIAPDYAAFGINRPTVHEFKTEPRFYAETFPDLVAMVIEQLVEEYNGMF